MEGGKKKKNFKQANILLPCVTITDKHDKSEYSFSCCVMLNRENRLGDIADVWMNVSLMTK